MNGAQVLRTMVIPCPHVVYGVRSTYAAHVAPTSMRAKDAAAYGLPVRG